LEKFLSEEQKYTKLSCNQNLRRPIRRDNKNVRSSAFDLLAPCQVHELDFGLDDQVALLLGELESENRMGAAGIGKYNVSTSVQ
jgi:hypothetical protein